MLMHVTDLNKRLVTRAPQGWYIVDLQCWLCRSRCYGSLELVSTTRSSWLKAAIQLIHAIQRRSCEQATRGSHSNGLVIGCTRSRHGATLRSWRSGALGLHKRLRTLCALLSTKKKLQSHTQLHHQVSASNITSSSTHRSLSALYRYED